MRTARVYDSWRDAPEDTIMVDDEGDKFKVRGGVLFWWEDGMWYSAWGQDQGIGILDFGPVTEVARGTYQHVEVK